MKFFLRFVLPLLLIVAMVVPMPAHALVSFGGRVVYLEPCISAFGASYQITISPAGIFPSYNYIWTPATITKLDGPPTLGGQVIGVADIPSYCWNFTKTSGFFGLFSKITKSYLYGLRIQTVGTSPY